MASPSKYAGVIPATSAASVGCRTQRPHASPRHSTARIMHSLSSTRTHSRRQRVARPAALPAAARTGAYAAAKHPPGKTGPVRTSHQRHTHKHMREAVPAASCCCGAASRKMCHEAVSQQGDRGARRCPASTVTARPHARPTQPRRPPPPVSTGKWLPQPHEEAQICTYTGQAHCPTSGGRDARACRALAHTDRHGGSGRDWVAGLIGSAHLRGVPQQPCPTSPPGRPNGPCAHSRGASRCCPVQGAAQAAALRRVTPRGAATSPHGKSKIFGDEGPGLKYPAPRPHGIRRGA
jgi:hypothetical protein